MNKYWLVYLITMMAHVGAAMPLANELSVAKGAIDLLAAGEVKAIKGGKNVVVAAKEFCKIALESTSEAEKYWLYRWAFSFYVQGDELTRAVDVLAVMKKEIRDFPVEESEKIINAYAKKFTFKKGNPIANAMEDIKNLQKAKRTIETAYKALEKKSDNTAARRAAGEAYVVLGDWGKALEEFTHAGGKLAEVAEGEKEGKCSALEAANFWKDFRPVTRLDNTEGAYRAHAMKLYQVAVDSGKLTIVQKMLVKQKMDEIGAINMALTDNEPALTFSAGRVNYKLPDVVAYWPFDGDFVDEVKRYSFTRDGDVEFCKDRRNKAGKALSLVGGKRGLVFPSDFGIIDDFTIALWVKPEVKIGYFPPQENQERTSYYLKNKGPLLISPGSAGPKAAGIGIEIGEDGVIMFEHAMMYVPATLVYQGGVGRNWTHIVITRGKGVPPVLYINGKNVAAGLASTKTAILGKGSLGEDLYMMTRFSGCIDDLVIYSRVLTDGEIKKISKK